MSVRQHATFYLEVALLTSVLLCVIRLELDNLAAFLRGAVAYKRKIGFTGKLLLEPKPQVRDPGAPPA